MTGDTGFPRWTLLPEQLIGLAAPGILLRGLAGIYLASLGLQQQR